MALPFGRQRGLALLAVLAAEPQPHSRDRLLGLLWPLFEAESARNNLRRELSLLRDALGDALLADRATVALDPEALAGGRLVVDTYTFDRLLAETAAHGDADGALCEVCAARLSEAAALYSAAFLAGFALPDSPAFDEWHFFQSAHYRDGAASVFRRLAGWHEARGAPDAALEAGRRWLALDPLHEPAHRLLMRLYEASGQHAAALRQYETLVRALRDEMGAAPEPETTALWQAMKARQWTPAPAASMATSAPAPATMAPPLPAPVVPAHNLPADTTQFIGRRAELATLDQLLADPAARLVTIAGPGGMGKTRLALAWTRRLLERNGAAGAAFPDGLFFVSLAPVDSAEQIVPAVARALNVSLQNPDDPLRDLSAFLQPRRVLLIMDNVEHLVAGGAARLLDALLTAAPGVRLLVTSRVRLQTRSEHLLGLVGLDRAGREAWAATAALPAAGAAPLPVDGEADDALTLFLAAARRVQPDFRADAANRAAAVRICRLVQGMPLAIELAAGWLTVLSAEEIVAELERSPDLLESTADDLPARQSSLRAVFGSSWRLLSTEEQDALRGLSVFRGGFDREAACAVAGASLKTIAALTAKSWLQAVGADRMQMHELLRQYAALELDRAPAAADPRRRHAEHYAALVEGQLSRMRGPQPAPAYDLLEREIDNVTSALIWLVEEGRLADIISQMLPALQRYLESRYRYLRQNPLHEVAAATVRSGAATPETAVLLVWEGSFYFNGYPTRFNDYQWVDERPSRRVRLAWATLATEQERNDFWGLLLAWEYGFFVDVAAGVTRLRQAAATIDRARQPWEWAFAHQCLGRLLSRSPHLAASAGETAGVLQAARAAFMELKDRREAAVSQLFLGYARQTAGDLVEARALMAAAQAELQAIGDSIIARNVNWVLADMHMKLGQVERALDLLVELADSLVQMGHARLAIDSLSRASYESLRYRSREDALRLRQRSLALSRAYGYEIYESWDLWELGQIYREMGDVAKARPCFEQAFQLFEKNNNALGRCFYSRGLGDLAMTEGNYTEAARQYAISRRETEVTGHPWQLVYLMGGQARAAIAGGDLAAARGYLREALPLAMEAEYGGGLTATLLLAGIEWLLAQGRPEPAADLGALVLAHPLTWLETRRMAAERLGLPFVAAGATQQPLFDLAPVVDRLLDELA